MQSFRFLNKTMRAIEFVEAIKTLCPTVEDLAMRGLSASYIEEIRNSYFLQARKSASLKYNDELLNFIFIYEVNTFRVTPFSFLKQPNLKEHYVFFAMLEIEYMAIDTLNNRIYCIDEDEETILFEAAINGSYFLEALYKILETTWMRYKNVPVNECELAAELALIAKGNDSLNFFKWVMGCFE